MGAAASVEAQKPADASDILSSESLEIARGEVVRLRETLGHLAKKHPGFNTIVLDASDLCKGEDEMDDFRACVAEIVHIRSALRLSTQGARRQTRAIQSQNVFGFGTEMGAAAALAAQAYQGGAREEIDYATDDSDSSDDETPTEREAREAREARGEEEEKVEESKYGEDMTEVNKVWNAESEETAADSTTRD